VQSSITVALPLTPWDRMDKVATWPTLALDFAHAAAAAVSVTGVAGEVGGTGVTGVAGAAGVMGPAVVDGVTVVAEFVKASGLDANSGLALPPPPHAARVTASSTLHTAAEKAFKRKSNMAMTSGVDLGCRASICPSPYWSMAAVPVLHANGLFFGF
jgi:hypothetical protein